MRIELIHPMLIHFPIALLLTGIVLKAFCYFVQGRSFYSPLLFSSRLILSLGVVFAWIAISAGELAADVVGKNLCLPKILEDHSILAYTTAFLFTAGVIFDFAREWSKLASLRKGLIILSSAFLLVGSITLLATAFFGGKLVYEQGAAVDKGCPGAPSI